MLKLCGIGIGLVLTIAALAIHAQTTTGTTATWENNGSGIVAGNSVLICPEYHKVKGAWVCTEEGNPPRFVPSIKPIACDDSLYASCVTPAHWECDKGYKLDGFTVEWSDAGIAEIKPLRCIK